jgi:hypothetical protein
VVNSALVVSPLCLDNEEIKEKDGDSLLFQDMVFPSMQSQKRSLNFKGLPIDSLDKEEPPLLFLVPHLRS